MWFDSHTHFDRFVEQDRLDALLEKAMDAKVSQMLAVGGSEAANTLSCNLANKFPELCGNLILIATLDDQNIN